MSDLEISRIVAYLTSELGYQSDLPGNLRRQVEENQRMIRDIEQTLRGVGPEIGVVGWISIFRRTWIALVALLGAAAGYLANDVVDRIDAIDRAPTPSAVGSPRG